MPRQHLLTRCALLLVAVLAGACSAPTAPPAPSAAPAQARTAMPPTAAPTATPTALPLPPQLPALADLTPAADAAASLEPALAEALGAEFESAEVPFKDPFSGQEGTCSELTAHGTGEHLQGVSEVMGILDRVLTSQGWVEDPMYVADGPTGTARGYRQGDALCVAGVRWEPSPDANCPKDRPIFECTLTPAQQLYTVSVQCVQGL